MALPEAEAAAFWCGIKGVADMQQMFALIRGEGISLINCMYMCIVTLIGAQVDSNIIGEVFVL